MAFFFLLEETTTTDLASVITSSLTPFGVHGRSERTGYPLSAVDALLETTVHATGVVVCTAFNVGENAVVVDVKALAKTNANAPRQVSFILTGLCEGDLRMNWKHTQSRYCIASSSIHRQNPHRLLLDSKGNLLVIYKFGVHDVVDASYCKIFQSGLA